MTDDPLPQPDPESAQLRDAVNLANLAKARAILARGRIEPAGLPIAEHIHFAGTIHDTDRVEAFQVLERLVFDLGHLRADFSTAQDALAQLRDLFHQARVHVRALSDVFDPLVRDALRRVDQDIATLRHRLEIAERQAAIYRETIRQMAHPEA